MKNTNTENLIQETAQKNDVYRLFLENKFIENMDFELKHTTSDNSESLSSLQFDADCIKDVFDLHCNNFCRKYTEAISGLEKDNIFTLHSSSLLALLFFCGVSEDNPINIDGQEYRHVHFEHKNPIPFVSNNRHYTTHSNIDVVLSDKETLEDSQNILFLESKFTEYTHNAQQSGISTAAYGSIYHELEDTLSNMGLQFEDGVLSRKPDKKGHFYCEGIKQMICHFMGAKNFANETKNKQKNIKLGSIIYDLRILDNLSDTPKNKDYGIIFNDYSDQFSTLMQGLKNQKPEKLTLIPQILTYQNIYANNPQCVDDKIKNFYRLNNNPNK